MRESQARRRHWHWPAGGHHRGFLCFVCNWQVARRGQPTLVDHDPSHSLGGAGPRSGGSQRLHIMIPNHPGQTWSLSEPGPQNQSRSWIAIEPKPEASLQVHHISKLRGYYLLLFHFGLYYTHYTLLLPIIVSLISIISFTYFGLLFHINSNSRFGLLFLLFQLYYFNYFNRYILYLSWLLLLKHYYFSCIYWKLWYHLLLFVCIISIIVFNYTICIIAIITL